MMKSIPIVVKCEEHGTVLPVQIEVGDGEVVARVQPCPDCLDEAIEEYAAQIRMR